MFSSISSFLLIIIAALASIAGNSLFRLGLKKSGIESLSPLYLIKNFLNIITQPLILSGFIIFAVGGIFWLRVLTIEPLNKSYPTLTALVMIFLIISSIFILREPPTLSRTIGMTLIVAGTFLVFTK